MTHESRINHKFLVNNVKSFIEKLGINVKPEKIIDALCHKSYYSNYPDKIEQSKLVETLGHSVLEVITCLNMLKDNSVSNKQISIVFKNNQKRICEFSSVASNQLAKSQISCKVKFRENPP